MTKDELIKHLLGEMAEADYLRKQHQFTESDRMYEEGRLSVLNEVVTLLTEEDEVDE